MRSWLRLLLSGFAVALLGGPSPIESVAVEGVTRIPTGQDSIRSITRVPRRVPLGPGAVPALALLLGLAGGPTLRRKATEVRT